MLTTSYPATPHDHAGHFVRTLAKHLTLAGHAVKVITFAGPQTQPATDPRTPGRRRDEEGIDVLRVAYPGWRSGPFHAEGLPEMFEGRGALARSAPLPLALVALTRAAMIHARRMGPRTELVGHWLWPGGGIAQMVARALSISATTICHSGATRMIAAFPRPVAVPLIRLGLGAGPFIATCRDLVDLMNHTLRDDLTPRAHIAPMPIAPPERRGQPPPGPPFRLLTLSRHVPVKGLDLLVTAAAGRRDLELHICGDGPERRRLEQMCQRLNVNAQFHGFVAGHQKASLLSTCHAFALTSRRMPSGRTEGLPVALLEALSYDLPILATDVGGVAEALRGAPSAIVCAPDAHAIGLGLEQLFC